MLKKFHDHLSYLTVLYRRFMIRTAWMLRSRNGKFRQGVGIWLWVTNLAAKL